MPTYHKSLHIYIYICIQKYFPIFIRIYSLCRVGGFIVAIPNSLTLYVGVYWLDHSHLKMFHDISMYICSIKPSLPLLRGFHHSIPFMYMKPSTVFPHLRLLCSPSLLLQVKPPNITCQLLKGQFKILSLNYKLNY
jgi:hypothetical protein